MLKPYKEQLLALAAAKGTIRGGIVMPTGSGKSITMALIINEFKVRTLVIVPSLELKRQLTLTFTALFGKNKDIVVENIDNPRLKEMTDFDMLLLDECHHGASATYRDLNKSSWTNIYYRFYFSGTFFRNNPEEQLLFEGLVGRAIYTLSIKEAIKSQLIVPVEAYYIEIPKQNTEAYTYQQVYKELVVNHETRNLYIATLLARLNAQGKATLCLVKEVEHGRALQALTGLPFVTGADDASRAYIKEFNEGKIKTLIATTGMMGEGIDSRPCEYIIIAGLGKAKSHFMQQVGRGVRNYPGKESAKVIIIKDGSHKFLLRHFNAQCGILKSEYGVKPIKIDLD